MRSNDRYTPPERPESTDHAHAYEVTVDAETLAAFVQFVRLNPSVAPDERMMLDVFLAYAGMIDLESVWV